MNENKGYIRLYRKTLNNPLFKKNSELLYLWIYLLLNATYKEIKVEFSGQEIKLIPGQIITGRKELAANTGISESKIERELKKLENGQLIEQQKTSQGRLISIKKWCQYQQSEQQNEQQIEQQVNNKNKKNEQPKNEFEPLKSMERNETINLSEQPKHHKSDTNKNIYSSSKEEYKEENLNEKTVYEEMQERFGRLLTTPEIIIMQSWDYPEEIISLALDEATIANNLSIRYIDGIIKKWKASNCNSVEDVKKHIAEFKEKKKKRGNADYGESTYYGRL